ncbi:2-amino-4-hydroxy-6-hydroxymethyldihydropteridinediphosphokinase [Salinibacillus kushneri]|uniref:2-amino-4-hydroxy-6-hydroxymethyldihydropteridine diphosphokinase n=2 Tax=Salinibacillus kushneri TaxID=237682 RepID=A0A1I0JJ89_9BACI|nr:2-amino-4-hydroxy-6-hydroxymethyldihydropteridinediphosphokinase [Salinibacillus kushneri]
MNTAFIALGSNIDPREKYLEEAILFLREHHDIQVESESDIYETEPVGYKNQARFLNMVIKVTTELTPYELLSYCQDIEGKLNRKREIRFGPRTIDLDILLYNQENMNDGKLTIPHPRMHQRAFVLIPLSDIQADLKVNGQTVKELVEALPEKENKGVAKWKQRSGEEEFGPFVN